MTGRARLAAALAASILLAACGAQAQERGVAYDTILLAPKEPVDPDLAAFMADASDALWRYSSSAYGGSEARDPAGDLFTETVTILVGPAELTPDDRFAVFGRFKREDVAAELGRWRKSEPMSREAEQARGAELLHDLLADGLVGKNDQLEDRTCTGSFERISFERMSALLAWTGTSIRDWGVASVASDTVEVFRGALMGGWVPGQLLYVDETAPAIRSCCWGYLVLPNGTGAYVQLGFGRDPLVAYLASHVCFTKTDEGWRISAIALRRA